MSAVEILALLNTLLKITRDLGIEYKELSRLFARADSEGRDLTMADLDSLQSKALADLAKLADAVAAKKASKTPTMKVPT